VKPRIILVPSLTELEWPIKPLLEEWAEVATYDAPGVGREPPPSEFGLDAVVERGLAELDRRGWDRYFVAGDEFGVAPATLLAAARPSAVAGLALGHACLSLDREGPRAAVNGEVMGAFESLMKLDYRTFVRHLTQITRGAYDDELAERYLERVPHEISIAYGTFEGPPLEPLLRRLGVPLLLAKHDGCLAWKDEAFEDVVAAFPDAMTMSTTEKPSASPEFDQALRSFCSSVSAAPERPASSEQPLA
jgi:pimeloyl-ACP methyl ester carboxylesterase